MMNPQMMPNEKAKVASEHPQYCDYKGRWDLARNVVSSKVIEYIKDVEDVKSLTEEMATEQQLSYYKLRNVRYKDDAQFVNVTRRTKNTWIGAIFRKPPVIELPESIDYLIEDATGSRVTLARLIQQLCGELLITGRAGLLTDHPASEVGLTEKEVEDRGAKARISIYTAESIINWDEKSKDGSPVLTFVMLRECSMQRKDGYTWESVFQYRELKLDDSGNYVQTLYNAKGEIIESYLPRDKNGNNLKRIPFAFVGAYDNNAEVDSGPLFDIAKLNIGHYRNSADYEEAVHICGQPTLIFRTNYSPQQFKDANPGGVVRIGSRRGINLGPDSDAKFLEVTPNPLPDAAMKRKEEQMEMIGARVMTKGGTNETAEAVRMKLSGETCELTIIAENAQNAIIQSCENALLFMGDLAQSDDIDVIVNTDFFEMTIDSALLAQLTLLMNNGVITKNDIRNMLRKAGNLEEWRTNEDIDEEAIKDLESLNPFGTNNDTGEGDVQTDDPAE